MKILVTGGLGYVGWNLVQCLVQSSYEVFVIDNLSRDSIDNSLGNIPLIKSQSELLEGIINFQFFNYSLCMETDISKIVGKVDFVVHLAEQRSAPYSHLNREAANYTLKNNQGTTVCVARYCTDYKIPLVHVGSMGVYGYDSDNFNPKSIYHLSKVLDANILKYFSTLGLNVFDLHKGIGCGFTSKYNRDFPGYINQDTIYGTVFNRFCLQTFFKTPLTLISPYKHTRCFISIDSFIERVLFHIKKEFSGYNMENLYTAAIKIEDLAEMFSSNVHKEENIRGETVNTGLIPQSILGNKCLKETIDSSLLWLEENKGKLNFKDYRGFYKWKT